MRCRSLAIGPLLALSFAACAPGGSDVDDVERTAGDDKAFTSAHATLMTFSFDGELIAPWQSNRTKLIKTQLFYLVGQLNAHDSVARLDRAVIKNVKTGDAENGWMKVSYTVDVPVAWGSKTELPEDFTLTLPRRIGPQSLTNFTSAYSAACSDGGHEINRENFWYHFRPASSSCSFGASDVSTTTAEVSVNAANTSGKYPEYDKVWQDGALNVVAVFGKYDDYATSQGDAGIAAYNQFIAAVRDGIGAGLATVPANVPVDPGVGATDVTWSGLVDGRQVNITALLINSPKVATAAFDTRYGELTKKADLVMYNGHAGLGANVQALANRGQIVKGQYRIFFINGCDTLAYLDETMAKRVAAKNSDDSKGTKYLDTLVNAMPAYFSEMPEASMALIDALGTPDSPKTFEAIFASIDKDQVVIGTGEEDNTFIPAAESFDGLSIENVLEKGQSHRFETPMLPSGSYKVKLRQNGSAGGDVDLYVGAGYAPTLDHYDFRPYLTGSNEDVTVTLTSPAKLFVMAHAYEDSPVESNAYKLTLE